MFSVKSLYASYRARHKEKKIDLVTVFEAILTSRQTCEKLQCLYGNLMSNDFRKTAVLKKNMTCKLKLQNKGLYLKIFLGLTVCLNFSRGLL